jgi:ABC-type lipoprotein export system ATPase subunit
MGNAGPALLIGVPKTKFLNDGNSTIADRSFQIERDQLIRITGSAGCGAPPRE